jgi:hypothetical protein
MSNPAAYIQPIQFEDFDGSQFERLVFAYHACTGKWKSNGTARRGRVSSISESVSNCSKFIFDA